MLKKSLDFQSLQTLSASVIPFAALLVARVLSPLWQAVADSAPGKNAPYLLPTSAQSTAYHIAHNGQRR